MTGSSPFKTFEPGAVGTPLQGQKIPPDCPGSGHSPLPDLSLQCCASLKRQRSAESDLCKVRLLAWNTACGRCHAARKAVIDARHGEGWRTEQCLISRSIRFSS
ncbi:MAG: hypothetical protein CME61_09055 [Halobacteriovoraceae bacterium]|nr:hypothetical protein [Halobacteriovoraceae bacterium]